MLEKLAGRIRWEQTGNGIRVEIPAKLQWGVLLLLVWLSVWIFFGSRATFNVHTTAFFMLGVGLWMISAVWAMTMIWSTLGRTTLLLDPSVLQITHRIAGFAIRRRSIATSDIRNLRYVPESSHARVYIHSRICFESRDRTVGFGSDATGPEGLALIQKMLEICPSLRDPAASNTPA